MSEAIILLLLMAGLLCCNTITAVINKSRDQKQHPGQYLVATPDFSEKGPHFSAKCKIFLQAVKYAERALFSRIQLGRSWARYPGCPRAFFGEPHVDVT